MTAVCECAVCKLLRRLEPLREKATPDERAALEELVDQWENYATDATYWRMKFKGEWREPT